MIAAVLMVGNSFAGVIINESNSDENQPCTEVTKELTYKSFVDAITGVIINEFTGVIINELTGVIINEALDTKSECGVILTD